MSTIAMRFQTATAAAAIAGAAVLTPAIAQADTTMPLARGLGGGIAATCEEAFGTADCASVPGQVASTITDNRFFSLAALEAASRTTIFEFNPLPLIPPFFRPLYSWFTQNINFNLCVGGVGLRVGPYGTTSLSVGSSC